MEKGGLIRTPQTNIAEVSTLRAVINGLKTAGLKAEGDATVVLSTESHTGATLRNLCNIIASKDNLLGKALSRQTGAIPAELVQALNETPIDTVEDFMRVYNNGLEAGRYANSGEIWFEHIPNEIGMCFFNATLNFNEALAYITLAYKLNEQAKVLKHTSPKEKVLAANPKYAMRYLKGNGAYRKAKAVVEND